MDQNQMMMEYLLEMGAMQPEQAELAKKQALVDALRQRSMQGPESRNAGRSVVAANPLEFLNQGLQGYAARKGQETSDMAMRDMSARRMKALEDMRQRMMPTTGMAPPVPGVAPAAAPGAAPGAMPGMPMPANRFGNRP
jgi:hypothetical protein